MWRRRTNQAEAAVVEGIEGGVALCEGGVVAAEDRLQHVGLARLAVGGFLRCAGCKVGAGHNNMPTAFIPSADSSIYAIFDSRNGAFLGRFDTMLPFNETSEEKVDPDTYITILGTEVHVRDEKGNILKLNKEDLKEKKKTRPIIGFCFSKASTVCQARTE